MRYVTMCHLLLIAFIDLVAISSMNSLQEDVVASAVYCVVINSVTSLLQVS
jgi:hypothetical protein